MSALTAEPPALRGAGRAMLGAGAIFVMGQVLTWSDWGLVLAFSESSNTELLVEAVPTFVVGLGFGWALASWLGWRPACLAVACAVPLMLLDAHEVFFGVPSMVTLAVGTALAAIVTGVAGGGERQPRTGKALAVVIFVVVLIVAGPSWWTFTREVWAG